MAMDQAEAKEIGTLVAFHALLSSEHRGSPESVVAEAQKYGAAFAASLAPARDTEPPQAFQDSLPHVDLDVGDDKEGADQSGEALLPKT